MQCSISGQTFPIDDAIASSDELLKDYLRPHVPNVENATITRSATVVTVVLKPGTKGSNPLFILSILIASKSEINPAVALNWELQNLERTGQLDLLQLLSRCGEIEMALSEGKLQVESVKKTLDFLSSVAATSCIIGIPSII